MRRGKVSCELAYAQGKMLDHSGWIGLLPRGSSPSDIDLIFDDRKHGRVLFVELSSTVHQWNLLQKAQREIHERLVAGGFGKILSVVCKHSVPHDRQIDTHADIQRFQIMYFGALLGWATSPVMSGEWWPSFVAEFFAGKRFSFPLNFSHPAQITED
jgi:hypothetical protein